MVTGPTSKIKNRVAKVYLIETKIISYGSRRHSRRQTRKETVY